MTGYILGADAEFDLDEIWEYIASDNIDAADRWIDKLYNAFEALAQMPGMGHRREDLTSYPVLFRPIGAGDAASRLTGVAPEMARTPSRRHAQVQGNRLELPWPVTLAGLLRTMQLKKNVFSFAS